MPAQDLHPHLFHSTAKQMAGRGGTGALERLRSCVSEHARAGIYIETIRIYGCPARDPDDVAVGNLYVRDMSLGPHVTRAALGSIVVMRAMAIIRV